MTTAPFHPRESFPPTRDDAHERKPAAPRLIHTEQRSAADLLLDYLEAEGTKYVFGVPGSAVTPIYEALSRREWPKHILAKHEEGAAFMAYGYARARRGLGAFLTTAGPGATNALTAVACAYTDGVPVLALTGQNPVRHYGKGALQDSSELGVDVVSLYKHVTKLSTRVPTAAHTQALVERALRTSRTGRHGPVHLAFPVDVQHQVVGERVRSPATYRAERRSCDVSAAREAAEALAQAERPAILAGYGVVASQAWQALRELATRAHIPVATTPKAKGVFPETDPLSLGVFGFGGHERAERYLFSNQCDVLLVVGSSLAEWTTHEWDPRLQPSRTLIQVDIDPEQLGKNYPIEIGVEGDAKVVLEELLVAMGPQPRAHAPEDPLLDHRKAIPRVIDEEIMHAPGFPLKPQRLVYECRKVLPQDALLVVDNGNSIIWATHYYEGRAPNTCFLSLGFASMGIAVSAAIGAKLAVPDRPVVALVGDAAFAMNGMEVHTAVDYDVPVVWIVLNDGGHGMVYHGEKMLNATDFGANRFKSRLDVCGVAKAMGADAVQVDDAPSFAAALARAIDSGRPTVIDAHVDPEAVPLPLAGRARSVKLSMRHTITKARSEE